MNSLRRLISYLLPAAPGDEPPAAPAGNDPAAPPAPGGDGLASENEVLRLRADVEARDREIERLKNEQEDRIQAEAARRAAEAIPTLLEDPPAARIPDYDPSAGYYRPEAADPADPGAPGVDDPALIANQRIDELETRQEMERLQRDMAVLKEKYPHMDEDRFLRIVAKAGDRPINEEQLAKILHESKHNELLQFHHAEMAKLRDAVPPPIPPNPAGVHSPGSGAVPKNPARAFEEALRAKGWGRG